MTQEPEDLDPDIQESSALTESFHTELSIVEGFEPKDPQDKFFRIRGKFATMETRNRNGRTYPRALWEREVQRYQSEIQKGTIKTLMEWDHPKERLEIDPKQAVAKINKLWIEGDYVMGEAVIFDTMRTEFIRNMIKHGVQISVSSRSRGKVDHTGQVQDFELITFDLVADPSDRAATMYGIFEKYKDKIMNQNDEILESLTSMVRTKDQEVQDLRAEIEILRESLSNRSGLNESHGTRDLRESRVELIREIDRLNLINERAGLNESQDLNESQKADYDQIIHDLMEKNSDLRNQLEDLSELNEDESLSESHGSEYDQVVQDLKEKNAALEVRFKLQELRGFGYLGEQNGSLNEKGAIIVFGTKVLEVPKRWQALTISLDGVARLHRDKPKFIDGYWDSRDYESVARVKWTVNGSKHFSALKDAYVDLTGMKGLGVEIDLMSLFDKVGMYSNPRWLGLNGIMENRYADGDYSGNVDQDGDTLYSREKRRESEDYRLRNERLGLTQDHRHWDVSLIRDSDPSNHQVSGEEEVLKIARMLVSAIGRDKVVGTSLERDVSSNRDLGGVSADVENDPNVNSAEISNLIPVHESLAYAGAAKG